MIDCLQKKLLKLHKLKSLYFCISVTRYYCILDFNLKKVHKSLIIKHYKNPKSSFFPYLVPLQSKQTNQKPLLCDSVKNNFFHPSIFERLFNVMSERHTGTPCLIFPVSLGGSKGVLWDWFPVTITFSTAATHCSHPPLHICS